MEFEITVSNIGDVNIVSVIGKVEIGLGSTLLRDQIAILVNAKRLKVILKLNEVSLIDHSVISELASALSLVQKSGGRLVLLNPTKRVADLLQITKLYCMFEVYQNEEIAVTSFVK